LRSKKGLGQHLAQSAFCKETKLQLESIESTWNDSKPSAQDTLKPGKKKQKLEPNMEGAHDDLGTHMSPIKKMLDKVTLDKLLKMAEKKGAMVGSLDERKVQDLEQKQIETLGWLPYYRPIALEEEDWFATDASSSDEDEDEAKFGEEQATRVEDFDEDRDDDVLDAEPVGPDDAASMENEETKEEGIHRQSRSRK